MGNTQNPFDGFIFLDLEMLCDEPAIAREEMHIVEIGAVICDVNFENVIHFRSTVRPPCEFFLTDFFQQLVFGLSKSEIEQAELLPAVVQELIDIVPGDFSQYIWFAWGSDPYELRKQVERQDSSVLKDMNRWFGDLKHVDAQRAGLSKKRGLKKALRANNIKQTEPTHRALPDAISTYELAKKYEIDNLDVMMSTKKTVRENQYQQELLQASKLNKKTGLSPEKAEKLLRWVNGDFVKAKLIVELFKDGN